MTEHTHVQMLRALLELFYQPMLRLGFFTDSELANIFPSLEDLLDVHGEGGAMGGGMGTLGDGGSLWSLEAMGSGGGCGCCSAV